MGMIEIKISKHTGEITHEGFDYSGGSCVHAMEEIQRLIGLRTLTEETKPESVHTVECIRARR